MKVKIGPYRSWFGPYQFCDLLRFVGISEDKRRSLAEKISETPFVWFDNNFKKRKIKVKIDRYDVWSMDHTLSLIILPMLKLLKETKHGSPIVDDIDVPEHLKSTSAPSAKNEWDTDDNFHKRWEWVLDEMIWSFERMVNEDSELLESYGSNSTQEKRKQYEENEKRKANGFLLFGKYFQALWD